MLSTIAGIVNIEYISEMIFFFNKGRLSSLDPVEEKLLFYKMT